LLKTFTLPILLATTAIAFPAAARAQAGSASSGPPSTASSATADTGLEEVVVTAQRRTENVLAVPLSISVVSAKSLEATGLQDIAQLAYVTPGLIASDGVGYTQLYIRGVGNGIFIGADPSVATFIDDVPRIYGSMINTFLDVDRIEVLKGAQGGLYGRNATGGVVNIVTRQPSDEFAADARVSYGERNTFDAATYANIPLNDEIAWNVAVERQVHGYYVTNLAVKDPLTAANFPGNPNAAATAAFINQGSAPPPGTNDRDVLALDSKLRFQSGNFKNTLGGDYTRKNDSDGNGWYNTTPVQTAALLTGSYYFGASTTPPVFPGGLGTVTRNFTSYTPTQAVADITDYGGNDTSVLSLPGVDLTSISSFRRNETYYIEDSAGSSVPVLVPNVDNHKWNAYQELRAVSTGDDRLHLLGGATYLRNSVDSSLQVYYINSPAFSAPRTYSTDNVHSWSAYGQAGYDLTQSLNLTASLRYVHETNSAHFIDPTESWASLVGKKALPSATLSYKINNEGTVYVRYAKGFKTGGVNPGVPPSDFPGGVGSTFGPEQVDTYEAGLRVPFFNNEVQLTTAVFYNKYKGLQTITNGDATHLYITQAIINAGSARTYGAEGSVTWRVVRPVTLGLNVGYLNAKYETFALGANPNGLSAFNFSGQTMLFSPEWQGSLNAALDQPITDKLHLTGNFLYSYISRTIFFNSAIAPYIPDPVQPGYGLANLRIGVQTADQRVGFSVYANNLFNKGYTVFGGSSALGNQFTWGNPRIVGGEVTVKY
jgi:iron complex outermembrane recepter protein